jgi:hypothetical protein
MEVRPTLLFCTHGRICCPKSNQPTTRSVLISWADYGLVMQHSSSLADSRWSRRRSRSFVKTLSRLPGHALNERVLVCHCFGGAPACIQTTLARRTFLLKISNNDISCSHAAAIRRIWEFSSSSFPPHYRLRHRQQQKASQCACL